MKIQEGYLMKVAVVQTSPIFGDRAGNLDRALARMRGVDADIFLLPELFATGYLFESRRELEQYAEPVHGDTVSALQAFSKEKDCAVFAGYPESDGQRIYNSSALLMGGRLAATYRKLHLFTDEKSIFDRSEDHPQAVVIPKAHLGLMICFDWIFPEMARSLALKGAQVILNIANLVLPFCQKAMITRSLENGVYTLLANRVGTEDRGGKRLTFTGGSEIVSPRGEVLAQASLDREEVILAEIDPAEADEKMITATNHLLSDRRVDRYFLGVWDGRP
ncbi:MAG: nitrilase-related carbon-nitrogen hydrolase [Planctomycetota bacterium]|jgi:predicted amidohydrolase